MNGLARASLRHRRGGKVASFLAVFLGATILMAFSSMLDTSTGSNVSDANRTALTIMASVVGGWGAIIVASAIATTVSVTTRQRAGELALLRSAGATPRQIVRLIMAEVGLIGLAAAIIAVPAGFVGGQALLRALKSTNQVDAAVRFDFGVAALSIGVGVSVLAALIATWATARRSARRRVQDALLTAATGGRRIGTKRLIAGVVVLGVGISCAIATATVIDGNALQSQAVAAEAAILSSIGFALLAPVILSAAARLLGPVLRAVGGAPGQLAVLNIRQRTVQASTPLMPIVVCTAVATGTLYLQSIWSSAQRAAHIVASADDKNTETLNYVVVGMIALFAAVMLVNLLTAEISDRRREFAQLRLVGVTPRQVSHVVGLEDVLILVTGLLFGSIAGLLTIVPYSLAVNDRAVPHVSPALFVAVLVGVTLLTFGSSLLAAHRATRAAATDVIHGAAS